MRIPLPGTINTLSAIAIGVTLLSGPVQSQGIPTIDVSAIAQIRLVITQARAQLEQLVAQNLTLDAQTLRMIEQVGLLQEQIRQFSEGLSLADLGLGPDFLEEILPAFADLNGALAAAKSGNWADTLTSNALAGQSVEAYVTNLFESAGLPRTTVDQLAASTNPATARIGTAANTGAFLSVAAQAATEDAADSLGRLEIIAADIASTTTLKAALDLNTRATIELGISLAQIAMMTSVQTVGLGEMGIMDAATAADEEAYIRVLP